MLLLKIALKVLFILWCSGMVSLAFHMDDNASALVGFLSLVAVYFAVRQDVRRLREPRPSAPGRQ